MSFFKRFTRLAGVWIAILAIVCVAFGSAMAADAPGGALADPLADPLADRLHALGSELRCLVCQNESLADSSAPLAMDLKREIRAQMQAGQSDAQIRAFLHQRYGDFVSYQPPFNAATLLLWAGPLLLLVIGGAVVWRALRAQGAAR
ncbi:MAG: cytochrome c-type biogenesis protein CcmH [Proteobacteria bacterium]|nr:cytochrome c-type biogenesis protein CcmH [Pseudomonadota bacterium]